MTFVSSPWYIVMALIVVAIVALVVVFVMMDKKDRALIEEFIQSNTQPAEDAAKESANANETDNKKE